MVNKAILVGRVGKDPQTSDAAGTQVSRFTLATGDKYKNKAGEMVEATEWHNITCWRQLAEFAAKHIQKGQMLAVQGKITTRSYDTDGQKHYTTEIVASDIKVLDWGKKPEQSTEVEEVIPEDVENEDLPF